MAGMTTFLGKGKADLKRLCRKGMAVAACFAICFSTSPSFALTRIKDITNIRGVRANQVIGYGLVVGLNGTGDTLRNAPFTNQSIQSMLDRMGVNVQGAQARTKNVAAVIVTAELPAFIGKGSRIDVTVSSLGDATSLAGGSLLMSPLSGPDNMVYAVAQGPVAITGFAATGKSQSITQGVPTTGRIANGALIEREAPGHLSDERAFTLDLLNPDFMTSIRIADAINAYTEDRYRGRAARSDDLRSVSLVKPPTVSASRFIAEIGELDVEPDTPARIIIDERTGTIVIGRDVKISTVAVTHGDLTVKVTDMPKVSQPLPFSKGTTTTTHTTDISAKQTGGPLVIVEGTSLQTLVNGLNRMGLKPPGIIAILQAIKSAGALHADLVVQ